MSRGGRPGRGRYVAALLSIAALLSLVVVIVIRGPAADPVDLDANPHFDPTLPLQERVDHVLERMNLDEKVAQLRGLRRMQTPHNRRLGIPDFRPTDGPHGVNRKGGWLWERKTKATAFPVSIALAATWDPALAERVGAAIAREARALDRNWLLAPCVNIVRDPRAGRTQESFGEDPMLAARIGEAFVIGVQEQGVIATPKHFACNNQETERQTIDARVGERALREIYLPAFKATVDAGALAVMASYNQLNGVPTYESRWLLTEVLREEWGFRGLVVSDWESVTDGEASLRAGLDVEMPKGEHYRDLAASVRSGRVDPSLVDTSARRVLQAKIESGLLMEDPQSASALGGPEHLDLALEVARGSIVLLRNENDLLPLERGGVGSISLLGPHAAVARLGDGRSSEVSPLDPISPLVGLRRLLGDAVDIRLEEGVETSGEPVGGGLAAAAEAARAAEVAVLFLGLDETMEGEALDRVGNDILLPEGQLRLLESVVAANPRTVLVLVGGSAMALRPEAPAPAAIMQAWYPGERGGDAIAEILFGVTNPSGRLPVTFPQAVDQLPGHPGFPDHETSPYEEGVFVGYRYFDRESHTPWFPFGHGLSYTRFEYRQLEIEVGAGDGSDVVVSLELENVGERSGEEVVQLYIGDPEASVPRPPRELKGLRKVTLKPGQVQGVRFALSRRDFAFWDSESGDFRVEPGRFIVSVGASSRDLRLEGELTLQPRSVSE